MVLSSYLPLAAVVAAEASPADRDVPTFVAHGVRDPVMQLARATAAASRLLREQLGVVGYKIQWYDDPMEHSVCMEEVQTISAWLGKVLGN
jgi:phospholipase/carboxylesterase